MSIQNPQTVQDHLNRKAALDLSKQLLTKSGLEDTQFDQVFSAEQTQDDVAIASAVKAASASSPIVVQADDGTLYVANGSAQGYGVVTPTPANRIGLDGAILSDTPTPAPGPVPTPTPTPTPAPPSGGAAVVPPDGSSGGGSASGSGSASSDHSGGTPATDAAGNPIPAPTPAPGPTPAPEPAPAPAAPADAGTAVGSGAPVLE